MQMRYLLLIVLASLGIGLIAQTPEELNIKAHKERVMAFRAETNEHFADTVGSPLMEQDIADFEGLKYFDVDPKYLVQAEFILNKKAKKFKMKTTTDRKPLYSKYAKVRFELKGEKYVLNVYRNLGLSKKPGYEDYLFIPFTDLTNGESTYGGGRYLDIREPKDGKVEIDFNLAYNPYCAYNYKYSCPIVPLEDHLPTRVEAGVKKYKELK